MKKIKHGAKKLTAAEYYRLQEQRSKKYFGDHSKSFFVFFSSRLLLIRLSVRYVKAHQTKTHRLRLPKTLPMRSTAQLDSPPDIAEPGNQALRGMICFADTKICHSPVTSKTGERMMTLIPQLQYSINFKKCKGLQLHAKQRGS